MQLNNPYRENAWGEEEAGKGWRSSVPGPGCLEAGAGIDVPSGSISSLSVCPVGEKQMYSLFLANFPF